MTEQTEHPRKVTISLPREVAARAVRLGCLSVPLRQALTNALGQNPDAQSLSTRLRSEIEHQRNIELVDDQESMHLGVEGNFDGEREAKLVSVIAKNMADRLEALLNGEITDA